MDGAVRQSSSSSEAQIWTLPAAYGTFKEACTKKQKFMNASQPDRDSARSDSAPTTSSEIASGVVEKWRDMTMSQWGEACEDPSQTTELRKALDTVDRDTFNRMPETDHVPVRAYTQALSWCIDACGRWVRAAPETDEKALWSAIASAQEQRAQILKPQAFDILSTIRSNTAHASGRMPPQSGYDHGRNAVVPNAVSRGESPDTTEPSLSEYLVHLVSLVELARSVANQRPVPSQGETNFFDLRSQANSAAAAISLLEDHHPSEWPIDEETSRDESRHWHDIPLRMHEEMQGHLTRGDGAISSYSVALATRAAQAVGPTDPARGYSARSGEKLGSLIGNNLLPASSDRHEVTLPALKDQAFACLRERGPTGSTSVQST